jgi:hypothetical protein
MCLAHARFFEKKYRSEARMIFFQKPERFNLAWALKTHKYLCRKKALETSVCFTNLHNE